MLEWPLFQRETHIQGQLDSLKIFFFTYRHIIFANMVAQYLESHTLLTKPDII